MHLKLTKKSAGWIEADYTYGKGLRPSGRDEVEKHLIRQVKVSLTGIKAWRRMDGDVFSREHSKEDFYNLYEVKIIEVSSNSGGRGPDFGMYRMYYFAKEDGTIDKASPRHYSMYKKAGS